MITSPCKDCKDRIPGCHCNCDLFISYRKEYTEEQSNIRKSKTVHGINYELRQMYYKKYRY